jgi:NitT/TauT family transport system substrate-binding protein
MTFLWNNGLSPDSVQTLDIKPSASLDALMKDQVDAIVSYGAFFLECQKSLGEKALVWPVQEGQEYYFLALSRENLIKSRPLTIERFLAALADAETFQKEKSAEARKIIGRYLKVDDSYLAAALPRTRLTLRLDQGLLILMEEEAKWALRNQLIDNKQVPNYFHSIYLDGLEKVKPEAVTVIH